MYQEPKSFKTGGKHVTLGLEGDSVFILLRSKYAVCHYLPKIFAIQASIERIKLFITCVHMTLRNWKMHGGLSPNTLV